MSNRIPLEGTVQGYWSVLQFVGNDGKKSWYLCRCLKCGRVNRVRADKLRSGKSTMCPACSYLSRQMPGNENE